MLYIKAINQPPDEYDDDLFKFNSLPLFDILREDSWFENPLVIDIINNVDKCEIIGPRKLISHVLGDITPKDLSNGTKMLLIILFCDMDIIYNGNHMGPNCSKWLLKIAEQKDVTVCLGYHMDFDSEIIKSTTGVIRLLNDGKDYDDNGILQFQLVEEFCKPFEELVFFTEK